MDHSAPAFAAIAANHTILQCQVGSGVHGTAIAGTDDRDEMGICVEPPEYVIGLQRFEQYIYRTATERTGDPNEPSQAGDLDLTVYSLRKWLRLALQGNPTVLLPLYAPDHEIVTITGLGRELRDNAGLIISRQAGHRFIGYLRQQRQRMLDGTVAKRVNRPALVEEYGFDTKFAGHMVRLGLQGVELMETGSITLPVPEPWRSWIRELRQGGHTQQEALDAALEFETKLLRLVDTADMPERPDAAWADRWLMSVYERAWTEASLSASGVS